MTPIEKRFKNSIRAALQSAESLTAGSKETIEQLRELLLVKGKEYRRNNDPFHNFNVGAEIADSHPMTVLYMFRLKHVVSIKDLDKDFLEGKPVSLAQVNEKFNDMLIYTLIELAYYVEKQSIPVIDNSVFRSFLVMLNSKINFVNKINERV